MSRPKEQFILFKKVGARPTVSAMSYFTFFQPMAVPGDEWKAGDEKEEPKDELEYVAAVTNPREVAAIVRRAPMEKYVLFRGYTTELQVAMPVFMDGVALDSMTSEWAEPNDA